jgi:uncharacterized protein involved in response to NO
MTMYRSSTSARSRAEAGWLFAAPFRPFFIAAASHAALAIPLWLWLYLAGVDTVAGMPAAHWHAHELVLGYLPAIMAGYLLSTTPNWSGSLPASGIPLLCLVGLWAAGRLTPMVLPAGAAVVIDAAFPLTMGAVFMREAWLQPRKGSRHGLMLFPLLAILTVADRVAANDPAVAALTTRACIGTGALLIAAVGGRLVPSITRTELPAQDAAGQVPEPYGSFDIIVVLAAFAALNAWIVSPFHPVTAVLASCAGLLHLVRLVRWRGWLLRQPGALALHAGYLWLAIATLLAGLAADPLALVPPDAALHAFTAGAIGTMTMAVMVRLATTRGTGRRPTSGCCSVALLLVNAGAVFRVAAPLLPAAYVTLLLWGGLAWSAGFAMFVLAHWMPTRRSPSSPERLPDRST